MKQKNIRILKVVLIFHLIIICEAEWFDMKAAREGALTTVEFAEKYGYPIEEYTVETEDGNTLRLYRIPHGPKNKPKDNEPPRQPVLLMHGIVNSSDIWLLMGPVKGFGFILADQNFDVWLGDFRGSRYSNELKRKKNEKYWDSSFNEMGIYDYPAFINKILKIKRMERKKGSQSYDPQKLIIFAHSMGTTSFYVLTSEKPEYVKANVMIMISFAPVAYMTKTAAGNPFIKNLTGTVAKLMMQLGMTGLDGEYVRGVGRWLALDTIIVQKIFSYCLFFITGDNDSQLDKSTLPVIYGHMPSGCTTKTLLHYEQLADSGKFRKYDYGAEENLNIYKQDAPPDYKLGNNLIPIVLCYGSNDNLSHRPDFKKLYKELKRGTGEIALFRVNDDNFSHMDFMFAKDIVMLLYDPIINVVKDYVNNKTLKTNKLLQRTILEETVKKS